MVHIEVMVNDCFVEVFMSMLTNTSDMVLLKFQRFINWAGRHQKGAVALMKKLGDLTLAEEIEAELNKEEGGWYVQPSETLPGYTTAIPGETSVEELERMTGEWVKWDGSEALYSKVRDACPQTWGQAL